MARRPLGARHAGAWEFPGGKQEPGETLEECIRREIREELDIDIILEHLLIAVDHDYGAFSLTLHAFLCRPADGLRDPKGQDALAWSRPEELDRFDLLPPDRRIVAALRNFLKERGEGEQERETI